MTILGALRSNASDFADKRRNQPQLTYASSAVLISGRTIYDFASRRWSIVKRPQNLSWHTAGAVFDNRPPIKTAMISRGRCRYLDHLGASHGEARYHMLAT